MKSKEFTILSKPQKYMTLAQIKETYGSRAVVAYNCIVENAVPLGGYVIAVQNNQGGNCIELKEFQRNLKKEHPDKKPIFYFCLEEGVTNNISSICADEEIEKVKILPEITIKKSLIEEAFARIPEDMLAKAISTSLKLDD